MYIGESLGRQVELVQPNTEELNTAKKLIIDP